MVTFNSTQRTFVPTAPKPEIDKLLPDIPGGEPGLLPAALTGDNLKVWFTIPLYSDPVAGEEKYELFVDDKKDAIATRYWTTPIDDSDRYLELPKEWLRNNDGQHRIYYTTTIYNGAENYSFDLMMTLDTKAPVLASGSKLIFPPEVLPPYQITAGYLADPAHQDQVLATLPNYTEPKVGDVITWYWERIPRGEEIAGTKTLERDDMGTPVQASFKGDLLRNSTNNTDYYASYRVRDRAGNETVLSSDVKLSVNIRPPTPRKFPTVKQAATTGATGLLNPFLGSAGVTVVVLASEVDPGDAVKVDFVGLGGEGGVGSAIGLSPITPGGLEFDIPASIVAANIAVGGDGRKVEVRYWAGRDTQHSAIYTLSIQPFSGNSLGSVECDKAQIGSPATISKATVANSGANIQIDKWVYHESSQLINVWGIASGARTDFLKSQPAPISGSKFTTPLPKGFISPLALNSTFTLNAEVSFDQGHSFHPFRSLLIKVVP